MDQLNADRYLGVMLDGRYEPLEVIGRGGMATVYKGYDHLLNRNVAIKFLRADMAADSDFRLHFKKEAQAVAKLSHANIVSVYDVSRSPDVDYIVMELIEGVTLKQYMKSKGRLSCRECAEIACQIAKALSHAHSKGIIHRDIKPQNIMVTAESGAKVADFGIAHLESALGENKDVALGSVHYISPEQARGLPPDARSDIYSLGVVLYEMLSGVLPYQGNSPEEIARQHISSSPMPLHELSPDVPEELEAIVRKAMEPDIEFRYQHAEDMVHDLEAYLNGPGEGGSEPDPTPTVLPDNVEPLSRSGELAKESYLRRHRRSNKVSLLVGVLLSMVFAGALFYFLWNYWLQDIFGDAPKIYIQDFVGRNYEDIINNRELKKTYNFTVDYDVSTDVEAGTVVRQDPSSGSSRTRDSKGIDVTLYVSAGAQMIQVPDVLNSRFTDAVSTLQKSGFLTEVIYDVSDSVTVDYVISTSPEAGDKIPVGATVYVTVSSGPNVTSVPMPNLIGLTRDQARERIEASNLAWGNVTYVESEKTAGYVIWQSVQAYTSVEEHTKIYIQISLGPKTTPTPSPTTTPAPTSTDPPPASNGDLTPVAPSVGG